MRRKRNRKSAAPASVLVARADVLEAIRALDASEQLFDLLRGELNGDDGVWVDDLICVFLDRVIVGARLRLARTPGVDVKA